MPWWLVAGMLVGFGVGVLVWWFLPTPDGQGRRLVLQRLLDEAHGRPPRDGRR